MFAAISAMPTYKDQKKNIQTPETKMTSEKKKKFFAKKKKKKKMMGEAFSRKS